MNRAARELSDFFECVQARLNKHRDKEDIDKLTIDEVLEENVEENFELFDALLGGKPDEIEYEAVDRAVAALMAWVYARNLSASRPPWRLHE